MDAGKCRFPALNAMGLVGGRFDHQPKPLIWRVFGQSLRTCVQRKPTAAYARTQQNTQILLYRGSYSPTVGSKVGLHKGFNADKAPDTPPGRVDDVVGGFQITSLYSVTGKSTSCRSPCMAFLPPSGGVFRLALARSLPGIPCRRSFDFQGAVLDLTIKNRHTTTET